MSNDFTASKRQGRLYVVKFLCTLEWSEVAIPNLISLASIITHSLARCLYSVTAQNCISHMIAAAHSFDQPRLSMLKATQLWMFWNRNKCNEDDKSQFFLVYHSTFHRICIFSQYQQIFFVRCHHHCGFYKISKDIAKIQLLKYDKIGLKTKRPVIACMCSGVDQIIIF